MPHHGDRLITHQPFKLRLQLGVSPHSILGQSLESRTQAARFMKDQAKVVEAGRLRSIAFQTIGNPLCALRVAKAIWQLKIETS